MKCASIWTNFSITSIYSQNEITFNFSYFFTLIYLDEESPLNFPIQNYARRVLHQPHVHLQRVRLDQYYLRVFS